VPGQPKGKRDEVIFHHGLDNCSRRDLELGEKGREIKRRDHRSGTIRIMES